VHIISKPLHLCNFFIRQDKASRGRRKGNIEREKRRDKHAFKGDVNGTVTMERTSDIVSYGWLIHDISYREKKETMNIMRIEYYLNTPEHRNVRGEMEMIKSLDLLHSPEIERITRLMALEGAIHFQSWRCWRVSDFAD